MFLAPFALEIAATLLIHPLLVGVAGISRAFGAPFQGTLDRLPLNPKANLKSSGSETVR